MTYHPITVSNHQDVLVVRDDTIPGGTKSRAIEAILDDLPEHIVYASPAYGYAQVALAHGCKATGRQAHIITASRKRLHPRTEEAIRAGAYVVAISPGYLSQAQAFAREHAETLGGAVLPFGFDTTRFRVALAAAIHEALAGISADLADTTEAKTLRAPREVWVAAGSGTLSRTLQEVWPDAEHHAVMVGRHPDTGKATLHTAPEPFERDAKTPPPYPSTSNFDAKVWQFAGHRGPGTLIWNVAR